MGEYTSVGILYTSFQTALLACIRYWLYQDDLRAPAKVMYTTIFAVCAGTAVIYIFTDGAAAIPFSFARIALAAVMYLISCFIIMEPPSKHSYTYSFIMAYDSVIEISASYAQSLIMPGARGWVFAMAAALLLAVTFIPSVRYLKRMIERLSRPANDKLWSWLCVISFSFVFMNLLFTYQPEYVTSARDLFSRYLMMLGIMGLYLATTRAVETMREAAEVKAELGVIKKRVDMQESYYARLVSQMDEVRRMRHDLRHHRAVLASLAGSGDIAALSDYLDSAPTQPQMPPVTGNLAADSILTYYMDEAQSLGAVVETELSISGKLPVSDSDLCVILGNLLENAVEAQKNVKSEDRFIRVRAKANLSVLTLAVDNRFNGEIKKDEAGRFLSGKPGVGHGLGIGSVRVVCEKYEGILQIETDGDMFMAGVVIGL